eukprot:gene6866-7589_t
MLQEYNISIEVFSFSSFPHLNTRKESHLVKGLVSGESELDQIDSDHNEELHTYRSPAKEKTPSSSIPLPSRVPTGASVTGNKKMQGQVSQPRAPNNANNRSSSNSNPSKLLISADGGGQPHKIIQGTSPKGNKMEVNWQARLCYVSRRQVAVIQVLLQEVRMTKRILLRKFSTSLNSLDQWNLAISRDELTNNEYELTVDLNTEELVVKRKNMERIKEFSKLLRVVNQDAIQQQRKLPPATEQIDIEKSEQNVEQQETESS